MQLHLQFAYAEFGTEDIKSYYIAVEFVYVWTVMVWGDQHKHLYDLYVFRLSESVVSSSIQETVYENLKLQQ